MSFSSRSLYLLLTACLIVGFIVLVAASPMMVATPTDLDRAREKIPNLVDGGFLTLSVDHPVEAATLEPAAAR